MQAQQAGTGRGEYRYEAQGTVSEPTSRNIMFVIEALTVGGAEQMVVDLANEFSSRGDRVLLVCLSMPGELAEKLDSQVQLEVLNKRPGIDLGIARKLRHLARRHDIKVVNSHLWTANLWTRLALFRSGIPVVSTEHNRDVWKGAHNRFIDRTLSHTTARLIAVSEDTAEFYRQDVGIRPSLISVVNNGVDTTLYSSGKGEVLRQTLIEGGEFLVGTVGRLAEAKNHPRLVAAAALAIDAGVPLKVVIAGEGPDRSLTEASIEQHKLHSHVKLLGERTDIPDLLAALDVFVLSSDREGHPLSALEAQAAGTPVVLTDAGGSADAVSRSAEGHGGLLVEKTPQAIAASLIHLASHPEELSAMSDFARTYAARFFDKQTMIDRYSEIFDVVTGKGVAASS